MSNNIYCGSGTEKKLQYGPVFDIYLSPSDIDTILNNRRDDGSAKLCLMGRRTPGETGNTHYLKINDFVPTPRAAPPVAQIVDPSYPMPEQLDITDIEDLDDCPF